MHDIFGRPLVNLDDWKSRRRAVTARPTSRSTSTPGSPSALGVQPTLHAYAHQRTLGSPLPPGRLRQPPGRPLRDPLPNRYSGAAARVVRYWPDIPGFQNPNRQGARLQFRIAAGSFRIALGIRIRLRP